MVCKKLTDEKVHDLRATVSNLREHQDVSAGHGLEKVNPTYHMTLVESAGDQSKWDIQVDCSARESALSCKLSPLSMDISSPLNYPKCR